MHVAKLLFLPWVGSLALMGAGTEINKQQSTIMTSPSDEDFIFVGCFSKTVSRVLQDRDRWGNAVTMQHPTIGTCVSHCYSVSFTFAGVGDGK